MVAEITVTQGRHVADLTADELRRALKKMKLTQRAFAAMTGASAKSVNRWCMGAPIPRWVGVLLVTKIALDEAEGREKMALELLRKHLPAATDRI
jgi:DNA-binding transcriptional regulator YiaG